MPSYHNASSVQRNVINPIMLIPAKPCETHGTRAEREADDDFPLEKESEAHIWKLRK